MIKQFRITPVHDRLLRGSIDMPVGLYHLHLATAEQLTRLYYSPKSIKWVQANLKALADNGFVLADASPKKHHNSHIYFTPRYYYTLGAKSVHYLQAAGLDVSESYRASREIDKHALFVEHTLEVNDLLIAASLLRRLGGRWTLAGFVHERALRQWAHRTRNFTIIPDAFLRFTDGIHRSQPFLLEHDRGTEEQQHFRRRISAYADYLQQEQIPVLFSTFQGPQRLVQMREWTHKELAGSEAANWFRFANLQPPLDPLAIWIMPCWFTVQDQQPIALLKEL